MHSIQTKFILLILSCVLLSSFIIGGAGIHNSKRLVADDSARIMNLLCREKAKDINALLSRIEQSVNTLTAYAMEQLDAPLKLRTDDAYVDAYTRRLQAIAINAANNTEGALAVYVRYNPAYTQPTSGLFWSRPTANSDFEELTPTDFSKYSPEDTEHVGWYYIPVRNGRATWMSPYLNQNINVEMISYVVPLIVDQEAVGVVGMDIDFNVIRDIVSAVQVYENGSAFLTDNQGTLLYHKELSSGTPLRRLDERLAAGMDMGDSENRLLAYRWRGEENKFAFCGLSNGMHLAISAPAKEIDADRNRLIWLTAMAMAAIAVVFTVMAAATARRMSQPLRELTAAAKKIAAGDLSISLTCHTEDEVGVLAESFQQTVTHLQKYIDYINGLAYRDALTGVKNKTAYQEAINRLEDQIRLGRPEFAVVVLDINNLKTVNDTCGHDFGDMLIIDACKLICKTFQHSPVFRIGGDEFVVLLENGDYDHYAELLDRFNAVMEEYNQPVRAGNQLSIARGIAIYGEAMDLTYNDVFKRADNAMYQNKAAMKLHAEKAAGN